MLLIWIRFACKINGYIGRTFIVHQQVHSTEVMSKYQPRISLKGHLNLPSDDYGCQLYQIIIGAEEREGECESLMTEIEQFRSKKATLKLGYHSLVPQSIAQQTLMVVCDACGCFLSASDSDERIAEHVKGTLHNGVVAVRQKINHLHVRFT